jgi:hypothetical protein
MWKRGSLLHRLDNKKGFDTCRQAEHAPRNSVLRTDHGRMINDERNAPMIPSPMSMWPYRFVIGILLFQVLWGIIGEGVSLHLPQAWAESNVDEKQTNHHDHPEGVIPSAGQWEGSPEGIAYSEFNHALVGMSVLLVGLSELRTVMGWQTLAWFRWILPASLISSGIFLLIWSDHEAWPVGSWTLAETLSGKDPEMLQHRIFGILVLGVGMAEWFLRTGKLCHQFWRILLPGLALVGGLMLFIHMHGPHPASHHIQTHHNVMGMLALAGGLAWFAGEFMHRSSVFPHTVSQPRSVLKILWALFVVTIGVQLLFYSES